MVLLNLAVVEAENLEAKDANGFRFMCAHAVMLILTLSRVADPDPDLRLKTDK